VQESCAPQVGRTAARETRPDRFFAGSVSEAQKSSYVVNTNVIFCSRQAGGENRIRVPRKVTPLCT